MSRLLPLAVLLAGSTTFLVASAQAPGMPPPTPAPKDARLYIISPANGATLSSPVKVMFGLSGMGVAPAGVQADNTGHHHLLVDTDIPADTSQALPSSDKVLHFGKGQTEASIELAPGQHTLQLVLGDFLHRPLVPVLASAKITITVK